MGWGLERDEFGERTGNVIPMPGHDPETGVHTRVEVVKPVSATLPGGPKVVIECSLHAPGDMRFRMKAHMANHFRKSHQDLYEDKDSWRTHFREITLE